jgi:hypothetical protein
MSSPTSSQIAALNLSAMLFALAEINPFFAEILETAATDIQQRGNQNSESDLHSILYAIRKRNCWTIEDIATETSFARPKVCRLLRLLISRQQVYTIKAPLVRGRGGNRKLLYHLPVEQSWVQSKIKK